LQTPLINNFYKYSLIFFYFIILEGVLRKWLIPEYNIQIVVIRDLFVIYLIYLGLRYNLYKSNSIIEKSLLLWSIVVLIWSLIQLLIFDFQYLILLNSLRNFILYFWLAIFIFRSYETSNKIERHINAIVMSIIPMAILVIIQYNSNIDSFINKQIGESYVFRIGDGIPRATGTFTFTSGFGDYISFISPLVLYKLTNSSYKLLLKILLSISLFICVTLSGSRGVILQFLYILIIFIIFIPNIKNKVTTSLLSILIFYLLINTFSNMFGAIEDRFYEENFHNYLDRIKDIFFGSYEAWINFTLIGKGLGIMSNYSNQLIETNCIFGENETDKLVIGGGILGIFFIFCKFLLSLKIFFQITFRRNNNKILLILFGHYFVLKILTAPLISQITTQAFIFLSFGIMLKLMYENNHNW